MKRIRRLVLSPVFHAALLDDMREELRRAERASSRSRLAVIVLVSTAAAAFVACSFLLFPR